MFASAKTAQKAWAKTPLHARATLLHRVAELMRHNAQPIAVSDGSAQRPSLPASCSPPAPPPLRPGQDCLVKEIAKPAKDALAVRAVFALLAHTHVPSVAPCLLLQEVVRSADLIDYTAEEGVRVGAPGIFADPVSCILWISFMLYLINPVLPRPAYPPLRVPCRCWGRASC
jgi:glyceraldehyde-3-phosphate dehydrogenase (NADP+)